MPASKFSLSSRLSDIRKLHSRTIKKKQKKKANRSIKLYMNYFIGVFANKETLERVVSNKDMLDDSELVLKNQCVPLSMYLLGLALQVNSSFYKNHSLESLTGLGESVFSENSVKVLQDIFPSVDVEGRRCATLFSDNIIYGQHHGRELHDLSESITTHIIKPFLKRYPSINFIATPHRDFIIIPFGYNIYGENTKVNSGHQLLMVIDLSKLYEINHSMDSLLTHTPDLVQFIDNMHEGIVPYNEWFDHVKQFFIRTVDVWKNPPEPRLVSKKVPSWAPKPRVATVEEHEAWKKQKQLANKDNYVIIMSCLTTKNSSFSLASLNVVGAMKKNKKKKKKTKKKKKKKKTKKKSVA